MAAKRAPPGGKVRPNSTDPYLRIAAEYVNVSDVFARYAHRKKLRPQEKAAISRTFNRYQAIQRNLGKIVEDRATLVPVKGRDLENARKQKLVVGSFNVIAVNAKVEPGSRIRVRRDGSISQQAPRQKGKISRSWHYEPVPWKSTRVNIRGAFTAEKIGERFRRKAESIIKRGKNPRIYLKTKIAVMYRLGGFDEADITRNEVERWVNQYVVNQNKFFDDELGETNWDWVQDVLWGVAWHDGNLDAPKKTKRKARRKK